MNIRNRLRTGSLPILLTLVLGAFCLPPTGRAAPYHGHFIICSDRDDLLKMTADLSDGKGEKVAVGVANGQKQLFPEMLEGRASHQFSFYPSKKVPLVVTARNQREPEIRLTLDPAPGPEGKPEKLHERTSPFLYRISRYDAILSLRSLKVENRKVTCTESQWESN